VSPNCIQAKEEEGKQVFYEYRSINSFRCCNGDDDDNAIDGLRILNIVKVEVCTILKKELVAAFRPHKFYMFIFMSQKYDTEINTYVVIDMCIVYYCIK
jgi:hypothetical protein